MGFVGVVDTCDAELAAKTRLDGGDVDHLLLLAELALAVRTGLTDRLVLDEDGGHALTNVVLGKVGHLVATLAIELDVDLGTAVFVETGLGTHDVVTGQDHALLQHHGTTVAIVVDLGARRHPACGRGLDVGGLIDHVELQGRGGPQDLLGTGGVLDTGQLHHDALGTLLLYQRLGHTQFVHPVTDDGDVLLEGVLLHFLDLGFTQASQQDEVIPFLLCGEGEIRILPTQEGGGLGLIGLLAEHHLHLITHPAHAGVTDLLGAQLGAEILHHLLLLLGQRLGHVHFHQEVHATSQVQTQLEGSGADGFEPGRRGRCQVEGSDEVVAQLVGDNVTCLELVFGIGEPDQNETVFERSMFDRDLSRFERLLHLIERL